MRRAMSVWTRVGPEAEQRAVRGLATDLRSGRWAERNGDLAELDAVDLGLRLLVACTGSGPDQCYLVSTDRWGRYARLFADFVGGGTQRAT